MIDIIKEVINGEEGFTVTIEDQPSVSVYKKGKHYIGYRYHILTDSWISNAGKSLSEDEMVWFIKNY